MGKGYGCKPSSQARVGAHFSTEVLVIEVTHALSDGGNVLWR
jgi:hypothetical protein